MDFGHAEAKSSDARSRRESDVATTNGYLPTPTVSPLGSPALKAVRPNGDVQNVGSAQSKVDGVHRGDGGRADLSLQLDGAADTVSSLSRRPSLDVNRRRFSSNRLNSPVAVGEVLKLSPARIQELTSSPESLPIRPATPIAEEHKQKSPKLAPKAAKDRKGHENKENINLDGVGGKQANDGAKLDGFQYPSKAPSPHDEEQETTETMSDGTADEKLPRPNLLSRTQSTPPNVRRRSASKTHSALQNTVGQGKYERSVPPPLNLKDGKAPSIGTAVASKASPPGPNLPSSFPSSIPLPPMSIPTYLELELSSERPSQLYIRRESTADSIYESSEIKFQRLMNFLLLLPELEGVLFFGTLTCVDSFLYTFTILPLRFFRALSLLVDWALTNLAREASYIGHFIYRGFPRWRHNRRRASSLPKKEIERLQSLQTSPNGDLANGYTCPSRRQSSTEPPATGMTRKKSSTANSKHRRSRSTVSALRPSHKADLIKGLLIITSSAVLLRFDASRMYHNIRGQNTIKLYLIFNVLEFAGKLLSAFGQDVLECLFSDAVLERDADGRSRIVRPFFMFILALIYNIGHSTLLFYQVVTLNVAVNSYSNALLSLLMSNQFVEIKSSVLKKIEKENLFQMTLGDVCERFELWLMLTIIALRNLVEVGSLSISISTVLGSTTTSSFTSNATSAPLTSASVLPHAFLVLPRWTGEVLGPFIIVLGSEMFVDYMKHAYITKFNNIRPNIYGRFLDVIARDYYSHAFGGQNITKRYGLPILPLACLSIRAIFQTYHMFLATHMPLPLPSTGTSVSLESATPSATTALAAIDQMFRRALGRSTFGAGISDSNAGFSWWSLDDVIALGTMLAVFGVCWLFFLAFKLVLGMMLLSFARQRYKTMKEREKESVEMEGKRVGAWGVVEVGEEKRKWIYQDDEKGLQKIRDRDEKARKEVREGKMPDLTNVKRYDMVAKRIW